jgi:triacylglycerol esterase/lipase EstA (alpha/beta hydrolase family)
VPKGLSFPSANGQPDCYNLESKNALPVLLIHGWNEGSGGFIPIHWDEWKLKLNQDEIPFCIVSFEQSSDACGSASDHAKELPQIVQNLMNNTKQDRINLIGYSKGGLDARVYLANNLSSDNVAINECDPGIKDIKPGAPATLAAENTHTKYFTIAGTCLGTGDGFATVSSVNSESYFQQLGTSNACHADLLGDHEYGLARGLLTNKQ